MASEEWMRGSSGVWARGCAALEKRIALREWHASPSENRRTPARERVSVAPSSEFSGNLRFSSPKIVLPSCGAAVYGRRRVPLRKNIIGHRMPVRRQRFIGPSGLCIAQRPFVLLDEPARQHGASVFIQPFIQQCANFFAEIGGMAETRKFKALQRVARGREKELPRGLHFGTGHVGLLESNINEK
ncbi:MAG: hypothetical protein AUH86_08370 [Acidobacteria bacterium 13_1_40CM_4_58_4]|nr:MAG: hypothetical protein AUH86_08370 [Acidobacteria bacterium 13_1_40CM_4_58_4]